MQGWYRGERRLRSVGRAAPVSVQEESQTQSSHEGRDVQAECTNMAEGRSRSCGLLRPKPWSVLKTARTQDCHVSGPRLSCPGVRAGGEPGVEYPGRSISGCGGAVRAGSTNMATAPLVKA